MKKYIFGLFFFYCTAWSSCFFVSYRNQFVTFFEFAFQMALNPKFKIPTALELFKSIPNIRCDWKSKTPLQKWCYMYGIGKAPFDLGRFSLFRTAEEMRNVHWFAYFIFTYLLGAPLLSSYTLYYYVYRGDLKTPLASTCSASVFIAVRNWMNCFNFTQSIIDNCINTKLFILCVVSATCHSIIIGKAFPISKFNWFWWPIHLPWRSRENRIQSNLLEAYGCHNAFAYHQNGNSFRVVFVSFDWTIACIYCLWH